MNESYQRTQEEIARRLRERDAEQTVARVAAANKTTALPVFGDDALREFEASCSPMRIFDPETMRFLAVNNAAMEFYGYSREEFLDRSVADIRHPDEHAALVVNLAEQQVDYLRHRPARRHLTKSGEVKTVEAVTQDILFRGRRARLSLTIDITGRLRMQELLWQRQQEFEMLAEHSPDIVSRIDRNYRHLYVNSAVTAATGRPAAEFIGRSVAEVGMPPELTARWYAVLDEAFATGREQKLECAFAGPNGESYYESRIIPERGPSGDIETVLTVTRDFTERKKAENEVQRQKNLLAAIIDNLPVGVFIRDAKTLRYVLRNRFLENSNGYRVDTSVGKTAHDLFPKEQADRTVETDRRALESGRLVDIPEQEMLGPSGERRVFCVRKVPLLGEDGRPQLLVGIADDITQHKRAENALRESEERFRQLAENIRQVFWIATPGLERLIYMSPAYDEIWGMSREGVYRNPKVWMKAVHPEDLPRVLAAADDMARGGSFNAEYRIVRPDGNVRWIRDRSYPMKSGDGSALVCGIAEDITDIKIAEQEKLTHAIRQRDALVREVHHRIKNSLQGIVSLLRQKIRKHPAVAPDIEEAIGQLQSLALVYGLQETRPDGRLSLADITDAICSSAEKLIGGRVSRTLVRKSREQACIEGTEAVSLAVALNELVFNALKHQPAQAGRKRATVRLNEAPGAAEIRISNRGRLPRSFDFEEGRAVGYGLGLVRTLLAPPGGTITFNRGRDKVEVKLTLAPPLLAGRRKAYAK